MDREGIYSDGSDAVNDYFAFRDSFMSLASALKMSLWELEHFLIWCRNLDTKVLPSVAPTDPIADEPDSPQESGLRLDDAANTPEVTVQEAEESAHTHIQWLLATIGKKMGCRIWIARNDQNKTWNGSRLGEISIPSLPSLGIGSLPEKIIGLIDVLWLKDANRVVAAFEVEHTTSVYSGLLRMSDLVATLPNISFPLYIVTPEARMEKVRRELSRPTFQALDLHTRCGFFSEESLIREVDAIMKWANDPSAIERLASRVSDSSPETG